MYQMPPVNEPNNLTESLDQALRSLRAATESLLHEVLSQHHRLPGRLSLVPVNVDTHSQDGEIYLTVRYRFQAVSDAPDSPSNSK